MSLTILRLELHHRCYGTKNFFLNNFHVGSAIGEYGWFDKEAFGKRVTFTANERGRPFCLGSIDVAHNPLKTPSESWKPKLCTCSTYIELSLRHYWPVDGAFCKRVTSFRVDSSCSFTKGLDERIVYSLLYKDS